MKKYYSILFVLLVLVIIPIHSQTENAEIFRQEGIASWYGKEFEGRPTASGEIFDASQLTAAHPNLPFGTTLVVTNQHNNRKVTVRVNDRGPFVAARIIDISRAAAEQLDMIITGTAPVLIESVSTVQAGSPPVSARAPVVSAASVLQSPEQMRLIPQINVMAEKTYRLQVGSYKIAKNAVDAFEKLKNSGLNPAYERYTDGDNSEYFRVVLAGVSGTEVYSTTERLKDAGFKEALIREEY